MVRPGIQGTAGYLYWVDDKQKQDANDLVRWCRGHLDAEEQALDGLDSTALNGIESTAGLGIREYVERGRLRIAAHRDLLTEYEEAVRREPSYEDREVGYQMGMEAAVCRLAAIWSAEPGYRPREWDPYLSYLSDRA